MKKFVSATAAVLAICLAGLAYYCSQHSMSGRVGLVSAFSEGVTTLAQTITDGIETEPVTETTTLTTTTTTTTTLPTTTKPTTIRETVTTVIKTTVNNLIDTGETSTKVSTYVENLNYGVTASVTEYNYYKIMSDGSSVFDKTTKESVYDRSGYSATTEELKPEAYRNMDKYTSERKAVLKITNAYRRAANESDLTVSDTLTRAANVRAVEIAWSDKHNHTRPNGTRCFTLFEEFGITTGRAGENIGWGYNTPEEVCKGWYDSYTHYTNIVDDSFTKTGVGVAAGPDGKLYWVQLFSS